MDHKANNIVIHQSSTVEEGVILEPGVRVWHNCHVRTKAHLGQNVSLGMGVYVDVGVTLGHGTRVQNGVSIYAGVIVEDWVFIGPHVVFTNDLRPRAGSRTWKVFPTLLKTGCSIGAGAALRCGIEVGEFAMLGAGATLTKSIPPFHLSVGYLAVPVYMICACGETKLPLGSKPNLLVQGCCEQKLRPEVYKLAQEVAAKL